MPHVVAVMVTGKSPERRVFAEFAVRDFYEQNYTGDSNLLIVRDDDGPALPTLGNAEELRLSAGQTLGGLRNAALDYIAKHFPQSWVIQWDDDDHHAEHRIAQQVRGAVTRGLDDYRGDWALTLRRQVRFSLTNNSAMVYYGDAKYGVFGTVLHGPTTLRYECVGKHEDSRFLKTFSTVHTLETVPELYVRFEHGNNTWNRQHIMTSHANKTDKWSLPLATAHYVSVVVQEYRAKLG